MLGGRPRSAFYYVAARSGQLYYLDPHTVQSYVHMERNYETSVRVAQCETGNVLPWEAL